MCFIKERRAITKLYCVLTSFDALYKHQCHCYILMQITLWTSSNSSFWRFYQEFNSLSVVWNSKIAAIGFIFFLLKTMAVFNLEYLNDLATSDLLLNETVFPKNTIPNSPLLGRLSMVLNWSLFSKR